MMTRYKHTEQTEAACYFITTSARPCFSLTDTPETALKVVEIMFNAASIYSVKIIAYAVMSSHVHLLGFCETGGKQMSAFMKSFKGVTWKQFSGREPIWEERFDSRTIVGEKMLRQCIEYIHNNPMKAGLVENPGDYLYSSAAVWSGARDDERIKKEFLI